MEKKTVVVHKDSRNGGRNGDKESSNTCLFYPDSEHCQQKNGECPKGHVMNGNFGCFPNKDCPDGLWRADDDESGACVPKPKENEDGHGLKKYHSCPAGSANPEEGCELNGEQCGPDGCGYYSHGVCETCSDKKGEDGHGLKRYDSCPAGSANPEEGCELNGEQCGPDGCGYYSHGVCETCSDKKGEASVAAEVPAEGGEASVAAEVPAEGGEASVAAEVPAEGGEASVAAEVPAEGGEASVAAEVPAEGGESVAAEVPAEGGESVAAEVPTKGGEVSVAAEVPLKVVLKMLVKRMMENSWLQMMVMM